MIHSNENSREELNELPQNNVSLYIRSTSVSDQFTPNVMIIFLNEFFIIS